MKPNLILVCTYVYIAGLSGWKLKVASWIFGSGDGRAQKEENGKQGSILLVLVINILLCLEQS